LKGISGGEEKPRLKSVSALVKSRGVARENRERRGRRGEKEKEGGSGRENERGPRGR